MSCCGFGPGFLLLPLLALGGAALRAEDLTIEIRVAEGEVAFGVAFPLTVVRSFPRSAQAEPFAAEALLPLAVRPLGVERAVDDQRIVETLRFAAYAFAIDALEVPTLTFQARAADGTPMSTRSAPVRLAVQPALDPAAPGPPELPGGLWQEPGARWRTPLRGVLGGLLILSALAAWQRRARARAATRAPADPFALAVARLAALRTASVDATAIGDTLAEVLRDCLRARGVGAGLACTTEQWLDLTADLPADVGDAGRQAASLLGECDRIRFAPVALAGTERERLIATAERLVEALQPEGPVGAAAGGRP